MPIFIANENGDWWEHRPGQNLYILDTETMLDRDALTDWHIYGEMHPDTIKEQGVAIVHDVILPEPEKVWYTEEELEAEVDEIIEAEFNEAYDETMQEVSAELGISEETLRDSLAVDEIVNSYIQDNITYAQMIDKIYNRMLRSKQ